MNARLEFEGPWNEIEKILRALLAAAEPSIPTAEAPTESQPSTTPTPEPTAAPPEIDALARRVRDPAQRQRVAAILAAVVAAGCDIQLVKPHFRRARIAGPDQRGSAIYYRPTTGHTAFFLAPENVADLSGFQRKGPDSAWGWYVILYLNDQNLPVWLEAARRALKLPGPIQLAA